jgi:hypothetical protein
MQDESDCDQAGEVMTIQPDLLMLEEAKPGNERNRQGESHVRS